MAMTEKQKGLLDQLGDALSGADGGVMTGSFINEIQGIMDGIKGLGIGDRGLDTPAERDFLYNTISLGTALTDADITKLGIGERGLNTAAERDFIQKTVVPFEANTDVMLTPAQREFIDSLPTPIRLRVEEHRNTQPPESFKAMINQLMEGVIGQGAVWEGAQQGANLGLSPPQNNQFAQYSGEKYYDYKLKTWLPIEMMYTGSQGGENYQQHKMGSGRGYYKDLKPTPGRYDQALDFS